MFGMYRMLLALLVVVNHFTPITVLGAYAVFAFFILSGYLMTWIMHHNYGYHQHGMLKFAANRFLRIYPIYWVSCLLAVVLILCFGEDAARGVNAYLYLPGNLMEMGQNIFLVFDFFSEPKLTPPAWALTVELVYYILIGLGLSKNKQVTLMWFVISMVYTLYLIIMGMPWGDRYFSFFAASLPFSIGAMIFHYKSYLLKKISRLNMASLPHVLFMLILLNFAIAHETGHMRTYGFYINILLNTLIILILSARRSDRWVTKRADRMMGDLSYPIYLIHFQLALLLVGLGLPVAYETYAFFFVSLPFLLMLAWLLARLVEQPIDRLRDKVKLG